MRIWDLPVKCLCDKHLLGEHRELHAIWSIITENKSGYSNHPETLRWKGKLKALYERHKQQVLEMKCRGFKHRSDLNMKLAKGNKKQDELIDSIEEQIARIKSKNCSCKI